MYSIVDSFLYARPHVHRIASTDPQCVLFDALCHLSSKEQFNELWNLYVQPGNQYDAMIEWAKQNKIVIDTIIPVGENND